MKLNELAFPHPFGGSPCAASRTGRAGAILALACLLSVSCREAERGLAERMIAPEPATQRSVGVASADSAWDTYSARITLRSEGGSFRDRGSETAFRVRRSRQPDGSWLTTMLPLAPDGDQRKVGQARIELGGDQLRRYDRSGTLIPPPDGSGFEAQVDPRHGRLKGNPEPPPQLPSTRAKLPVSQGKGTGWTDAVFAGPSAGRRAKARMIALFGDPDRTSNGHRYRRTQGDFSLEVLVDSLTGVPLELTHRRGAVTLLHATHAYDVLPDGSKILRETRTEQPSPRQSSPMILVTRYDSVSFTRGGTVR